MTPEDCIANIEAQLAECMRGHSDRIICPYCGADNIQTNQQLCCMTFGKAIAAILHRRALEDVQEYVDQVSEQASRN